MAYRVAYSKAVRRQLAELPGHIKAMARQRIAALSGDPRPPRSMELTGHPGYYRLWLGSDYRLVWHVIDDERIVEVEYVGPKPPDLYAKLGLGRPSSSGTGE
jgi:mRNA-degrading endonuclease RelE of RelBE toxin-antitoxin system